MIEGDGFETVYVTAGRMQHPLREETDLEFKDRIYSGLPRMPPDVEFMRRMVPDLAIPWILVSTPAPRTVEHRWSTRDGYFRGPFR